jgi:DNA-binding transcriptional regulator YiaG
MSKICPVCGSSDLSQIKENTVLNESFGGQKLIETHVYKCNTCESIGDFFNENEEIVMKEITSLKKISVKNIIDDFSENQISMAAIERALCLPQRTLARWRGGTTAPSATGLALLKFIRTFPWLLDVAEEKFDYDFAQKRFLSAAMEKFISSLKFDDKEFTSAGVVSTSERATFFANYDRKCDGNDSESNFVDVNNNSKELVAST